MATTKAPKRKAPKRKAPKRKATKTTRARSARGKCGKTCRVRTKGMGIGEVRKRTSSAGRTYEIIRVR
jgi:hypothetical protein